MLSPHAHRSAFGFMLILLVSSAAFAGFCPNCDKLNSDTGALHCNDGNIVCSKCGESVFPEQILPPHQRIMLSSSSFSSGYSIDATNQLMCHGFNITIPGVTPHYILTPDQISHLVTYIRYKYSEISISPHFLFTAVAVAFMQVLNTPELASLTGVSQVEAIWWLAAYWLTYQNSQYQTRAVNLLHQAPSELNLNSACQNVSSLQHTVQNQLIQPSLVSLFGSNNTLLISHALTALNNLATTNSHMIFQVTYPGGLIIVMHLNGVYYILTPYNRYYTSTDVSTVARILARIAQTQHLLRRAATTAMQVGILTSMGTVVGVVTGAPLALIGLAAGITPTAVTSIYAIWISLASTAFTYGGRDGLYAPTIKDDLDENSRDKEDID
ncbi:MAG: hypothetical protein ACR2PT_03795 [Endozoicomonas sp.]